MKFVQINGPLLTVSELSDTMARPGQSTDPWAIEGIADLVAAMTGTAASPVMVEPPSLEPDSVQVGGEVAVFFGTFTGATPVGVLRLNGVIVTDQIEDGIYTATAQGALTLTVTATPLAPVSVSATVTAAPALTATITPNPPVAGTEFALTWVGEEPADTSVTIDGAFIVPDVDDRYLVPAEGGTLVITGSRPGYTDFTATFEVEPAVEPEDFSVTMDGGTIAINGATGDLTINWTDPVAYEGIHTHDQSVEHSGPLNRSYYRETAPQIVVGPIIARIAGADDIAGATYRCTIPPLVLFEADNGPITVALEWALDGVATGISASDDYYSDAAGDLTVIATVTQAGMATRTAISNVFTIAAQTETRTMFAAPDGTLFSAFVDATGRAWTNSGLLNTKIVNNYLRGGSGSTIPAVAAPTEAFPADHRSKVWFRVPETLPALTQYSLLPAVAVSAGSPRTAYSLIFGGTVIQLYRIDSGTLRTLLSQSASNILVSYAGQEIEIWLDRLGDQLIPRINGALIAGNGTPDMVVTDATHSGKPGFGTTGLWPSAENSADWGTYAWDWEAL